MWQTKYLKKQWPDFSQIWRKNINLDIEKTQKTTKRIKTKNIMFKCVSKIFKIQRQRIVKGDKGEKKTYCIQDNKNANDS